MRHGGRRGLAVKPGTVSSEVKEGEKRGQSETTRGGTRGGKEAYNLLVLCVVISGLSGEGNDVVVARSSDGDDLAARDALTLELDRKELVFVVTGAEAVALAKSKTIEVVYEIIT